MGDISETMSFNNPAFKFYLFSCGALTLKLLLMSLLTGRYRFAKRIFSSPEDTKILKDCSLSEDDPDIERVRRAHFNDLENILPYFPVAYAYLMTGPTPWVAIVLMTVFLVSRFIHSYVYAINVKPQPARGLAFGGGFFVTIYMAVRAAMHFSS